MKYDPTIHHRRSIRLPGFDYSREGTYFVTICTSKRECILGMITNEIVELSLFGEIVKEEWLRLPNRRKNISLGEFVVMPNHFHGLIVIGPVGATHSGVEPIEWVAPTKGEPRLRPGTLGAIVGQFKSMTTKRINWIRKTPSLSIWQRNYYEHIVRDEEDHDRISEYIVRNPSMWPSDEQNPANIHARPLK